MKLLLTSNGLSNPSLEDAFLEMTGRKTNLKVALIPTAGDPIEWIPDAIDSTKFTAKLLKQNDAEQGESYLSYKRKGYDVIVVDLKGNPRKVEEKLKDVDIIDVGGGDVNYLLDWAKKASLDTYLKDLLDRGVIYIGTSAGCGLVTPDIGLTWWSPDQWAGTDHIGLGIVDFVIVPHQKESDEQSNLENLIDRKRYLQSIIDFPWRVYLLQDGQAVQVIDDQIKHIGPGAKNFI